MLVLNGRSYFPYPWPVFYAVPTGPAKESECGVTTSQWWLARTLNTLGTPRVMDLIGAITLQTLQFIFAFTATHIPGLDNSIADSLSRFQMDRFRTMAPSASPTASAIPPSAMSI